MQHVKYLLNELTLQNELQNFMTNNMLRTKKSKNTTATKHTQKHKNTWQSRESNSGPLAPQSDALPLDQRVNLIYRLKSSYFTV